MPRPIPRLQPGDRVHEFEVVSRITESGSSALYLVRPTTEGALLGKLGSTILRARVAVFGMSAALAAKHHIGVLKIARTDFTANLHDEHEHLSLPGIRHQHLVALYSHRSRLSTKRRPRDMAAVTLKEPTTGQEGSFTYLVLAYEPGESLAALLRRNNGKPLAPHLAVHIAHQTALALHHLHKHDIVHHDVKPSNILLRPGGAPVNTVLIDLGAAECLKDPRQRSIYGTKLYLPPERFTSTSKSVISPQIDVYGLGRTLFEMLTGPLENENTTDLSDTRRRADSVRDYNPVISTQLDQLVRDATERRLEQRKRQVPTLEAFAAQLEATPEFKQPLPKPSPIRRLVIATSVVMLIIVLLISFSLTLPGLTQETIRPTPSATAPTATLATTTRTLTSTAVPAPTSTRVPTPQPGGSGGTPVP